MHWRIKLKKDYGDHKAGDVVDATPEVEDPVLFPDFRESGTWRQVARESWPADEENAFDMTLELHDRVRSP